MPGQNRGTAPKRASGKDPRTLRGFSVRYADNGGAIVTHDMSGSYDGPYRPDPQHVFSTPKEVHAHLKTIYPAANIQEPGEQ